MASAAVGDGAPARRAPVVGVGLLMLCQSTQSILTAGFAIFLPLIRESLGLSFGEAGALSAVSLLVYACMQLPSGHFADRFGPRHLFLFGLVGTNVLSLTFAHVHTFTLALVNQAASGFFRALVFAPGLLLMTTLFPPTRRATAMGLYVAGGFSSNIFLNSLGPVLVGPLGWRHLFELFSLLGGVILVAYWRFGAKPAESREQAHVPLRDGLALFRKRAMWLIAGIQYVRLAVVTGVTLWLPTFLVVDRHRSLQLAGLLVAFGALLTAPANFLGGYVSDRIRNPRLVIGGSLAALAATTALIEAAPNLGILFAAVLVNSFFLQLYFGPLFALPIELFGERTAGLASGFGNLFANLGGLTFAYSLGALRDATGSFALGFYALAALCVVGTGLTVVLGRVVSRLPAPG